MDRPELTKTQDPAQDAAANLPPAARLLVVAGPGTGKTETVAKRLVSLTQNGVRPSQILVLSFSRSAVKTLTRRLEKFVAAAPDELEELRHLSIRTFDSWSFRLLRLIGHAPQKLLQASYDSNIDLLVRELESENREKIEERLASIRHVIVDEMQDLSGVRGALVLGILRLVAPPGKGKAGFTILGDEAQAIYGFANRNDDREDYAELTAGALIRNIRKTYARELKEVELKKNHRAVSSLASMVDCLRRILSRPISGEKKLDAMQKLVTRIPEIEDDLGPGAIKVADKKASAVLTRTNGEVLQVAQKLAGYDVEIGGAPILVRTSNQVRTVPAWIGGTLGRAKSNSMTRSQFSKIYTYLFSGERSANASALGVPPEDIAWRRLERATDAGEGATSIDLSILRDRLRWADLVPDDDSVVDHGVHVMTVHQSKGMEFSFVAVLESADSLHEEQTDEEAAEAASVIFVGVSRAGEKLSRIAAGQTYKPMAVWKCRQSGLSRWGTWNSNWFKMEMGIAGDIDPVGFVDLEMHGSAEAVRTVQEYLALNGAGLRGHKVMLCKRPMPGEENKYVYGIHLQEGNTAGLLLGKTTPQLTFDLLGRLHGKGYSYPLPGRIMNLRISEVVTMTYSGEASSSIAEDWARTGLWLGVNLYGTGDFKTFKKS